MKTVKDEDALALKDKISKRFIELREDMKKSQAELAYEIGTSQNLIFRLENGLRVSSESLFLVMIWYIKNHKLNTEWLMTPDNDELSKYHTSSKVLKRKKDHIDEQRQQIINNMLLELEAIGAKTGE